MDLKLNLFQDCSNKDQRFVTLIGLNWINKFLIQERKCKDFEFFFILFIQDFQIFKITLFFKKVDNKNLKKMEQIKPNNNEE